MSVSQHAVSDLLKHGAAPRDHLGPHCCPAAPSSAPLPPALKPVRTGAELTGERPESSLRKQGRQGERKPRFAVQKCCLPRRKTSRCNPPRRSRRSEGMLVGKTGSQETPTALLAPTCNPETPPHTSCASCSLPNRSLNVKPNTDPQFYPGSTSAAPSALGVWPRPAVQSLTPPAAQLRPALTGSLAPACVVSSLSTAPPAPTAHTPRVGPTQP